MMFDGQADVDDAIAREERDRVNMRLLKRLREHERFNAVLEHLKLERQHFAPPSFGEALDLLIALITPPDDTRNG